MASTILVVEDTKHIQTLLKVVLETQGMQVVTANNGEEASFQLFKNPQIDLIICDIMMPVCDGIEFLKENKELIKKNNISVLMLTALNSDEDIVKSINEGATDYLVKPIDKAILLERVNSILNQGSRPELAKTELISELSFQESNKVYNTKFLTESELICEDIAELAAKYNVLTIVNSWLNKISSLKKIYVKIETNHKSTTSNTSLIFIGINESTRNLIRKYSIRGGTINAI